MHLKLALIVGCCVGYTSANADGLYKTVDTDDIHSYWIAEKQSHNGPLFPRSAVRKHMDVCISVGFTVEPDGSTKNVRVLRSQTSKPDDVDETKAIESASTDAVSQLHYGPARENGTRQPILTYLTMSMAVSSAGTISAIANKHNEAVKQSCRIENFVASAHAGSNSKN